MWGKAALQTPKAKKKEVFQVLEQNCPAVHGEDYGEAAMVPCSQWKTMSEQVSTGEKPTLQHVDVA